MKRPLMQILPCCGVLLTVYGAACIPIRAELVGFDNLSNGTKITDQYQSNGVLFHSNSGGATIFIGGEATSAPNLLVGDDNFSDIFLTFVNPNTGLPAVANDVSVNNISVGHNTWTVTSRDVSGDVLERFVFQNLNGPPNGLDNVDPLTFSVDGISFVDFEIDTSIVGFLDGIGIDDLSFSIVDQSADFDKDGDIDGEDFLIWQTAFPTFDSTATSNTGDANGDGNVDGEDFLVWQNEFGNGLGGAGQAAIPEPAAAILAILALAAIPLPVSAAVTQSITNTTGQ